MPLKICRKFSESTGNFPKTCRKSVFQEFELKTFFHHFLTLFDFSERIFQTVPKNFRSIVIQVFTKCYFRCIFEFHRVFSRAFESVKLYNLVAGLRMGIYEDQ